MRYPARVLQGGDSRAQAIQHSMSYVQFERCGTPYFDPMNGKAIDGRL